MPSETVPTRVAAANIVGQTAATGVTRYDLENLFAADFHARSEIKVHLFCQPDRTTLRLSRLVKKPIVGLQYPRTRWEHNISYTVSVKRNHDGTANFNLYSYSTKRGLLNLTSRPELVFGKLPIPLNELLLEEAARLFTKNIRPWRVPATPLPYASDAILYNVYPAYFLSPATFDQDRRTFHADIPAAAYPLLRATSTDEVVDKLFGAAPVADLYAEFETGAAAQLYTAGLLFGKLVDAQAFTQLDWSKTITKFPLGEVPAVRRVLQRCDTETQRALFDDYVRMITTHPLTPLRELTDLLTSTRKQYPKDIPYRKVGNITGVKTFAALTAVVDARLHANLETAETEQKAVFGQVTQAFSTLFETSQPGYGFKVGVDEISLVSTRHNSEYRTQLVRRPGKLAKTARFNARFFGKGAPLPASNALQKTLKNITGYNATYVDHEPVLSIEDSIAYLNALADTLRRVAKRHQVAPTRANITWLLYYYLYYYDLFPTTNRRNQHLKPPPVPANMYDYVRDGSLPPHLRIFGLTWDMPVDTVRAYEHLPASVFKDFAHMLPKIRQEDPLEDF